MTKGGKTTKKSKKKAKFHDPPNVLRAKVGRGGLPPGVLARAEDIIDNKKTDFAPFARDILVKLEDARAAARKKEAADRDSIKAIIRPIMDLKAHSGLFNYALASEVAAVALDFLENIKELNEDGFEIVEVHEKTLEAIFNRKLTGNGGRVGQAMAQELFQACERYRKKYPPPA